MWITRLCKALEAHHVPYALVGGHAVALHGAVRGTVDIDFVIRWSQQNLLQAEAALQSLGLQSRLPVSARDIYHFRDEYIRERNLIAWSFWNPHEPTELVDLVIDYDLGRKKTDTRTIERQAVRLLNRDDLIRMKAASGRPQDLADIEALRKSKPR